jgi:lipopolysaccharide transport system permease protein
VALALRQTWEALLTLSLADLRDRFGRGNTRGLKWLLDPYATAGVYLVFVAFIIDRPGEAPGLSVACAVVPFQLFIGTGIAALRILDERRQLIQNLGFRRDLLPAAVTMTQVLGFGASLSLLGVMMIFYSVPLTPAALWLLPVVAVNILFALAFAYPVALFGIWFRELRVFAISAMRVAYFLAPGVIALSAIEGNANTLVRLNPLTGIFEAYRDALLYGHAPSAWELLIPLGTAIVILAIFVPIFRSEEPHLAKVT